MTVAIEEVEKAVAAERIEPTGIVEIVGSVGGVGSAAETEFVGIAALVEMIESGLVEVVGYAVKVVEVAVIV